MEEFKQGLFTVQDEAAGRTALILNPKENEDAQLIKQIDEITEEIEACAGGAGSSLGTGGMATKLAAAKKANKAGVDLVLANGEDPAIISEILSGEEIGTLFTAKK